MNITRCVLLTLTLSLLPLHARITKIVIERTESFADTGPYEKIIGRASGAVSPFRPLYAGITEIMLPPRSNG